MIKRRECRTGRNRLFTRNSKPLSSTVIRPFRSIIALAAYHLYLTIIITCFNTTCTAKGA